MYNFSKYFNKQWGAPMNVISELRITKKIEYKNAQAINISYGNQTKWTKKTHASADVQHSFTWLFAAYFFCSFQKSPFNFLSKRQTRPDTIQSSLSNLELSVHLPLQIFKNQNCHKCVAIFDIRQLSISTMAQICIFYLKFECNHLLLPIKLISENKISRIH